MNSFLHYLPVSTYLPTVSNSGLTCSHFKMTSRDRQIVLDAGVAGGVRLSACLRAVQNTVLRDECLHRTSSKITFQHILKNISSEREQLRIKTHKAILSRSLGTILKSLLSIQNYSR